MEDAGAMHLSAPVRRIPVRGLRKAAPELRLGRIVGAKRTSAGLVVTSNSRTSSSLLSSTGRVEGVLAPGT